MEKIKDLEVAPIFQFSLIFKDKYLRSLAEAENLRQRTRLEVCSPRKETKEQLLHILYSFSLSCLDILFPFMGSLFWPLRLTSL